MTDNSDLVARLARRGEDVVVERSQPITQEWNAPIDATQADSMSNVTLFQGWIAELKEQVWRWTPAPMPDDWYPGEYR